MSSLVVDNTDSNASDQKKVCVSDEVNDKDQLMEDVLLDHMGQLNINGRNTNIDAVPKYELEIEQVISVTCCSDRSMVRQVVVANKGDVNQSILCILDPPKRSVSPLMAASIKAANLLKNQKKTSSSNRVEDLEHDLDLALMERENFLLRLKRIDEEVQKMALPNAFDVNEMEDFVFQFEAFKSWVAVAADPTQQLMTVEGRKKKSSVEFEVVD